MTLEQTGCRVECASTAREAYALLYDADIDLVILDLNLPDEDGLVIARQIRSRSDVPIVIFTSNEETEVRLIGYELGVDDFIQKDTVVEELMLRIRNVLRRGRGTSAGERSPAEIVRVGDWTIDFLEQVARHREEGQAPLTATEFRILSTLARAPNRILSRGQLLDAISDGGDPPSDRMVDAFVSRIRKKLGPEFPLTTVKGLGYRLTVSKSVNR